jgi:hypothetical protein
MEANAAEGRRTKYAGGHTVAFSPEGQADYVAITWKRAGKIAKGRRALSS